MDAKDFGRLEELREEYEQLATEELRDWRNAVEYAELEHMAAELEMGREFEQWGAEYGH